MTLDVLLILVAAVGAVLGFRAGIIKQLGSVAGIFFGIIACRLFGAAVAQWLGNVMGSDQSSPSVGIFGYVLTFAAVYICAVVVAYAVRKAVHGVKLGIVDRVGGAVYKVLLYFFLLSLAINLWVSIVPQHAPTSEWGQRISAFAPAVLGTETATEIREAVHPSQEIKTTD